MKNFELKVSKDLNILFAEVRCLKKNIGCSDSSVAYVKTVNNMSPDEFGNVNVEGGGGSGLELGITSDTAFRGDYGQNAYVHSLLVSGNPHNVNKTEIGLPFVDNTSDVDKPVSTAQQAAIDFVEFTIGMHTSNTSNPHNVTATQVGLGNVNNTSDANKPLSTASISALSGKADLDGNGKVPLSQINDVLLGNVHYRGLYNGTIVTASPDPSLIGNPLPSASNVGYYFISTGVFTLSGNSYNVGDWLIANGTAYDKVDNTDAVSTVNGQTGVVVIGKSDVGLSNVDNTSDINKPVSSAQATAIALKQNQLNGTGLVRMTGTTVSYDTAVYLTSVSNANVTVGANIDAAKIGTGIVSTTEFNYLDGVTSSIQTQIDNQWGTTGNALPDATKVLGSTNNVNFSIIRNNAPQFIFNNGSIGVSGNTMLIGGNVGNNGSLFIGNGSGGGYFTRNITGSASVFKFSNLFSTSTGNILDLESNIGGTIAVRAAFQNDGRLTIPNGTQPTDAVNLSQVTTPVVEVVTASQPMNVNTKYIANLGTLVTLPLPATAAQGQQILVRGKGLGGWKITQNAGQVIHGASDTTTGTGGSIASQSRYDTVALECITANTDWIIISNRGTLTIV